MRDSLVSKLIELKEIKGTYLTFDSSNIPVKVKENNLKTSIKDRFSKTKRPKGDPESRLSIMVHFHYGIFSGVTYGIYYSFEGLAPRFLKNDLTITEPIEYCSSFLLSFSSFPEICLQ